MSTSWFSWTSLSQRLYILECWKFWKSKFSYWNWILTHPQHMSQRISLERPVTLPSTKIGPTNSNDSTKYRHIYIPTLFPPFTLPAIHRCFNKNLKNHKQRNQIRTLYDIQLSKSTLNWKRLLNITFLNTFCNTNCTL